MSKNTKYTTHYFQPEEYRFSLDSIFLAQLVAKKCENIDLLSELQFLDLCSGTGVIGLELALHLPQIEKIDFLEVQKIYLEYFNKNKNLIRPNALNFHFLNLNYSELLTREFENKYDIIMSNPPYFFQGEGLMSPNEFKNRCRFFIDSDFKTLIQSIIHALKIEGQAYLLVRPGMHHGRDLFLEISELIRPINFCEICDEIRGTNVVRIVKKA
jgi:tRNA1Val (adenine37-N6)-methyltransferase